MNTETDLVRRLLRTFPVKVIKEHFNIAGESQEEAINSIVQNNSSAAIKDFSFSHFNYSKQHIYVYQFGNRHQLAQIDQSQFPHQIVKQSITANKQLVFCLVKVTFKVIVNHGGSINEVDLKFYQPLQIEISSRYLLFRFSVLESKLTPYFPQRANLYSPTKVVDEKSLIDQILTDFATSAPFKADLNKGVKALWDQDIIDSKEVKFKKPKSVSRETMDEDKLVKVEYPAVYAELMRSPLNKTIFKYLPDNDDLCNHFTCDPTNGEITVPLYSKDTAQIDNTINEILTKN